MITHDDITSLRGAIAKYKQQNKSIAFVPTMGNLHAGHCSLLKQASAKADIVIASIFVNPLQFSPNEDFNEYPRTLQNDLTELKKHGCDLVYLPQTEHLIADNPNQQSQVVVPNMIDSLEGTERNGHLVGVATIVTKLFNIVQPDFACFGKKDYQQWLMIKQMVDDLNMNIKIIGCETVREEDGLALSSRNQYLNAEQRKVAPLIRKTLIACATKIAGQSNEVEHCIKGSIQQLEQQGFEVDYLERREQGTFNKNIVSKKQVLLCTARLGRTRLLDNIEFSIE
ncbi:MAG: pantoate--beta-alanine ligase [Gammaproteobacteria bacterium]|nr:pantoate--beta-alanine ligase [Gammaproteobacteria bacterium]